MDAGTDMRVSIDLLDVERRHRARRWRALLDELYLPVTCKIPDSFQNGRMRGTSFDGISIGYIEADPIMAIRAKSHLARYPLDAYMVVLTERCSIVLTQSSREVQLGQKSFAITSMSEASSFHQLTAGPHQTLMFPGALIRRYAPRIDDHRATPFGHQTLHSLFYDMATEWAANAHRMAPVARGLVADSIVRLLGLALDGADDRSAESVIRQAQSRCTKRGHGLSDKATQPA